MNLGEKLAKEYIRLFRAGAFSEVMEELRQYLDLNTSATRPLSDDVSYVIKLILPETEDRKNGSK